MTAFFLIPEMYSGVFRLLNFLKLFSPAVALLFSIPLSAQTSGNFPEWFYKTSPGNRIGTIGFSYKYTADRSIDAGQRARLNAVAGLRGVIPPADFQQHKKEIFSLALGKIKSVSMPGGMLKYGGSYREGVSVFEYIYYEPANAAEAANEPDTLYAPVCDFKNCRPDWLCAQTFNGKAGFLGISYTASDPGRQLEITGQNALDIAEYMLGINIQGKEQFYRSGSSVMNISFRYKSFDVQKQERTVNSAIYTKAQCFAGKTLFSWKMSRDIPAYPTATGTEWLKNPSAGQLTGAVGSAPKDLTGFISRQLKNAYEEGIAELAKIYGTRVQTDSSYTTKDGRTVRRETDIKISFEQQFKPRISGVYIDEQSRMYVWVTAEELSQSDSAGASSNPVPPPSTPALKNPSE